MGQSSLFDQPAEPPKVTAKVYAYDQITWPQGSQGPAIVEKWRADPPFQAHSLTSFEAAEEIKPSRAKLRDAVYTFIRDHGPATDQQISAGTGIGGDTERPRRVELEKAGLIRKAGKSHTKSGRSAYAWEAT